MNNIFPLNTYAFEKTAQTKTSKGKEKVQIEKGEIYLRYQEKILCCDGGETLV